MSAPTCSGGTTLYGGRRRRSAKSKKMRGGAMYGFGGALDGGTNGPAWGGVANLPVNSATGAVSKVDYTMEGGRRRRTGKKSRKGGRKSRTSRRHGRRRTMRGGAQWQSIAGAGWGYGGRGVAGMPFAEGYSTKGVDNPHPQNPDGGYHV